MCPVSIFDIYKVTLKHQNAAFTDKIATFAWSKKTVVGGCYGQNAVFVGTFLLLAGLYPAVAERSFCKTDAGITPCGKFIKS